MNSKRSKRKVPVEIEFFGDGTVQKIGKGGFSGGVPTPRTGRSLRFVVHDAHPDDEGIWGPPPGSPTVDGAFQVNVFGTSRGYRALAQYFLALAEIDSSRDTGFHEHVWLSSSDGRTRFEIILRKSR